MRLIQEFLLSFIIDFQPVKASLSHPHRLQISIPQFLRESQMYRFDLASCRTTFQNVLRTNNLAEKQTPNNPLQRIAVIILHRIAHFHSASIATFQPRARNQLGVRQQRATSLDTQLRFSFYTTAGGSHTVAQKTTINSQPSDRR